MTDSNRQTLNIFSLSMLLNVFKFNSEAGEKRLGEFEKVSLNQWFDINLYPKELSLREWSYEIYVRSMCYLHTSFGDRFSEQGKAVFAEYVLEKSLMLEKFEVVQIPHWDLFKPYEVPLKVIDTDDIFKPEEEFDKGELASWVNRANPISVNLEYSDQELIKAFKVYLKERREYELEIALLAKDIKSQVKEWGDFRLLALFDLLYWREFFDKNLTYNQIGHILWPDDQIELDQRVRKKGLPLIQKVFSESVAKTLYLESLRPV